MCKAQTNNAASKILGEIANNIISMIESGYEESQSCNWIKAPVLPPYNAVTGHRYSGINRMLLTWVSWIKDWHDPRFVTYHQCETLCPERKNHVLEGERSTKIIRPVPIEKLIQIDPEEDISQLPPDKIVREDDKFFKKESFMRYSAVSIFNVAQTNLNLKPVFELPSKTWEDSQFFSKLVDLSGVPLFHRGDSAYYSPALDYICLPPKNAFLDAGSYEATLAHEYFHSTGHKNRENRQIANSFGSEQYAMEELRAELFSTACMHSFGVSFPREKNATYIDFWRKKISDGDVKSILKAAADVDRVFSAILDVAEGQQPSLNWFPEIDFSSFPSPLKEANDAEIRVSEHVADEKPRRARPRL